jgi:hypothetical protein
MPYPERMTAAKFWAKVSRAGVAEGCMLWTGAVSSTGYGTLRVDGKTKLAHRHAYELAKGAIPKGYVLLHSCDVPLCCNPDHLTPGTHGDNARDRADKHRDGNAAPRPVGRRYW